MDALTRAVLSIVVALLMTLALGAFFGYPLNADKAAAEIARMNQIAKEHPIASKVELDRLYEEGFTVPAPESETGPLDVIRSILKWHVLILAIASPISILLFRPRARELILVGGPVGVLLGLWAGWVVGLALLCTIAIYCLIAGRRNVSLR